MPERMIKRDSGIWFVDCRYLGVRIRQSTGTTDRRMAERLLARWMSEVEGGVYRSGSKKFNAVAFIWIKDELPKKPQASQRRYKDLIENYLIPYFGSKTLDEIIPYNLEGKSEVSKFLDSKADLPKSSYHYFRDTLKWILLLGFPAFKLPKIPSRNPGKFQQKFLTKTEMESIVSLMSDKYRPLAWILAFTGIDLSECVDLKWSDIQNGFLVLPRSKTCIGRKIHLSPKVLEVLKDASRFRALHEPRVFPDHKASGLVATWKRARRRTGFDWARVKDLRHFFGSHLINSGVDSLTVARMMGHSDTKMILKRYGHLSDETIRKAVECFG